MTLTRISEMIHEWMGWCPNAHGIDIIIDSTGYDKSVGTGGAGRFGRGIGIAMGSIRTLILSGINILLYILALFVVPMLVLENKRLPGAVAELVGLIKKCWGETIICFLQFGLVFFEVSLTSLLFHFAYGVVSPEMLLFWRPGTEWIVGAALYMLVWFTLAMIGSTAGGISLFSLYTYAKSGRMPDGFGEK